jgi:hypothetical protein
MGFFSTLLLIVGVIVVAFIAFIVWAFTIVQRKSNGIANMQSTMIPRFGQGEYHLHLHVRGTSCIGISWERNSLIVGDDALKPDIIPLANVRAVSIEIDGMEVVTSRSTTKTDRGSQLVGGVLGGALLGPAGLIVGGLSGSSSTKGKSVSEQRIKTAKLVVRVADRTMPLRSHTFFETHNPEGQDASSILVKPELEKAAHFHALLTQVIEEQAALSAAE